MFFKVPASPRTTPTPLERPSKLAKLSAPDDLDSSGYYRRRVPTACDRCRLKKARCSDGQAPCKKCKRDGVLCVISKDRVTDTTPKPPAYVKMVESQRDLLLRTVVELQQRKNPPTGPPPDVNKVLEELNMRGDESGDTFYTLLQDSSLLQNSLGATTTPDDNSDAPRLEFTEREMFPWADVTSMSASLSTEQAANHEISIKNRTPGEAQEAREPGLEYLPGELLDTYQFDDNIPQMQWPSATDDPYLGYDANLAIPTFTGMDGLQQQSWQNGDVEFLDKDIMQNVP